jgi:hypothetical protein
MILILFNFVIIAWTDYIGQKKKNVTLFITLEEVEDRSITKYDQHSNNYNINIYIYIVQKRNHDQDQQLQHIELTYNNNYRCLDDEDDVVHGEEELHMIYDHEL